VAALPALVDHHLVPGPALPLPVVVLVVTYGVLLPAALTVTAVAGGRTAVRELLSRAVRTRPGTWTWLTTTLALPVLTVLLGAALGGSVTPDLRGVATAFVSAVTAMLLIHLVEELVWAGFVQQRLAQRSGVLPAAVLTAIPFAAVHLPLVLVGPVSARSVLTDAGGLLLLAVLLRVLVGALLIGTGGSVLAAAGVHAGFNAANNGGGVADRLLSGVDQGLLAPVAALLIGAALCYGGRSRRRVRPRLLRSGRSLGEEGELVAIRVGEEELPAAGAGLAGLAGRGESVGEDRAVEVVDVVDLQVQRRP
jgi:uncharacterized protein